MVGSPKDLAECLRSYAGDGTVEWVLEPMQSRVLSESARSIDEMAVLCADMWDYVKGYADALDVEIHGYSWPDNKRGYGAKVRCGLGEFSGFPNRMRNLGIEASE